MAPSKNSSCIHSTVQRNKNPLLLLPKNQLRSAFSMSIYTENSKYTVLLSIAGGMKPYLFFATIMTNREKKKKRGNLLFQLSGLYYPAQGVVSPFKCSSTKTHVSQRRHWQWFILRRKPRALPGFHLTVHLNHVRHGPTWLGPSEHWKESPPLFVTKEGLGNPCVEESPAVISVLSLRDGEEGIWNRGSAD